jgi:hypothetical protein
MNGVVITRERIQGAQTVGIGKRATKHLLRSSFISSKNITEESTTMRKNLKFILAATVLVSCSLLHAQDKPGITVASATYGSNMNRKASGNASAYVKSACDGKRSCQISVKDLATKIADPSPGNKKDFEFSYRCGSMRKHGHLDPEAAEKTALLSCAE